MPVPVPTAPADSVASQKNIWVAAGEGDLDRVRHLVEQEGISVTAADQWTYTPLHAAASYAQKDVLRYLLTHASAPSNAVETTDDDGDTPLFVCEDVSVAQMLVDDFRANALHENKEGNTPAMAAEENEHPELAAYFRSVTGEAALYANLQDLQAQDANGAEGMLGDNDALDEAIDARTDALMGKVQEILQRAEARGASSGDDLNVEEEEELRRVVGESLFTQIREGWGASSAVNTNGDDVEASRNTDTQNTPGR